MGLSLNSVDWKLPHPAGTGTIIRMKGDSIPTVPKAESRAKGSMKRSKCWPRRSLGGWLHAGHEACSQPPSQPLTAATHASGCSQIVMCAASISTVAEPRIPRASRLESSGPMRMSRVPITTYSSEIPASSGHRLTKEPRDGHRLTKGAGRNGRRCGTEN